MKVYLSGPMKGYPESNFPAFHAAAAALRAKGIEVVSPAELDVGRPPPPEQDALAWKQFYLDCLRMDIKALCDCEGIALLPGWEKSNGAHLELHVAHRLGLNVLMVKDLLS